MKQHRSNRWFSRAVSLALIPCMTGCTAALWTPACATQAVHPQIAGLVRNYPSKGNDALVITYHAPGDGTDVNLVVPLDQNGLPKFPFGINGHGQAVRQSGAREDVELAGFVEQNQLAAVLASGKGIPSDRESLKKHFNAADWSPAKGQVSWPGSHVEQQGTACLLAYEMDTSGQIVPVPVDSDKQPDDKIVHEPWVRVIMVPASVQRPPGDQTRNQVVAVALTPPAVGSDIAGTGAVIGVAGAVLAVAIPIAVVVVILDPAVCTPKESSTQTCTPTAPPPTVTVPIYFGDEKANETTASR